MSRIRRRRFLFIACGLLGAPFAHAQQAKKRFRIAWFSPVLAATDVAGMEKTTPFAAFTSELRLLGHARETLEFDLVSGGGRAEKYADIAAALVGRKPDVILVVGSQVAVAMKKATSSIPIVLGASADPVKYGLVASLARPGGNVTGVSADSAPEIEAKRLQLLREAAPGIKRVSCLSTPWVWEGPFGKALLHYGKTLGMQLEFAELTPTDMQGTFERIKVQRPEALFVLLAPEVFSLRQAISDFALSSRLACAGPFSEMADAGSLLSYGFNIPAMYRLAAGYVDKILRGANPAGLPVQLPNKFEFVINTRTATALGIKIPQSLLVRADRVIE